MVTDKTTIRILVIALTLLAAIGMVGTLWLLSNDKASSSVSVFVALAGVPIGAVAALATTRGSGGLPGVIQGPPGPPGPVGPMGDSGNIPFQGPISDPVLDEFSSDDSVILPGG